MIPTLTKPGLAELPPKSAYDKLAFIEAHYDEICEMYQTIMEHLKLPQVEGGSGVEYVTHEYKANYIDIYLTVDQLSRIGYTVEEAILKIPYRSFITSKDWRNPVEYNHSAKCKYQGTKNISGEDYYIFRFPRFLSTPYETIEMIGILTNSPTFNAVIKCIVNGSYRYNYSYRLNPNYDLDAYNCMFDSIYIEPIGSTDDNTDTFTEVYVKDTSGRYIC